MSLLSDLWLILADFEALEFAKKRKSDNTPNVTSESNQMGIRNIDTIRRDRIKINFVKSIQI